MTKVSAGLSLGQGSDAAFRVWGLQVNAALAAAGLTQTSDTGQINWATVTRASANTDAGYEIWRWNDTQHATRPIFLKMRYGSASVNDRPRMWIDIGEGSNGSGSLTGAIRTDFRIIDAQNSNVSTADLNICYNATIGYLGFALTNIVNAGPQPSMLSIDRLKDATGAATNRGAAVAYSNQQGSCNYWTFASAWAADGTNHLPLFWPSQAAGAASAGGTFISGLTPLTGNGTHGVLEKTLGFCGVGWSDFSAGEQFDITRWDGNIHRYLCANTYGSSNPTSNMNSHCRHAILWE